MITFVLVDNHPIVREGLRVLIESQPGWHVVGDAEDGITAVEVIEQAQPDIAIVDLSMPGMPGNAVVAAGGQRSPTTRCIVLSVHAETPYVRRAFAAGARGYAVKDAASRQLIDGVNRVLAGQRWVSDPFDLTAIDQAADDEPDSDPLAPLTPREREVFFLTVNGNTMRETGERLRISARTVETHRGRILTKLGAQDHTDLVRLAMRHGLIPTDVS